MVNPFPVETPFGAAEKTCFLFGDRGFLSDPEGQHGNILNPNLTTFDELQSVRASRSLGNREWARVGAFQPM